MLRAGASRVAIRNALVARVANHPGQGKPSILTGESRSAALTKLMLVWSDEVLDRDAESSP
jgi:hypothetical protein